MSDDIQRRDLLKLASAAIPMSAVKLAVPIPGVDPDGVNLHLPIAGFVSRPADRDGARNGHGGSF